ncbi:MAG TPA: class I SAM-dependent methyltransferase [Rheinheimera sp.]|nr:class I SAM-dependent methyltransferase [Rheinheimera sp.]
MSNTSLLICASQCWPAPSDTAANSLNRRLAQQALQRSGWRGRLLLGLLNWRCGRALLTGLLQFSLPGIMAHYHWRKQHIASWVQQHIEQQRIQQLLIVGAGFDGLGAALSAKHKQLQVIEIDRHATVNVKLAALQRLNALPPNLCIKAADLTCCSVQQLLADTVEFLPGRATLVLAEGVLMYLAEPAIKALLLQLQQSVTAPVYLVASQMQLAPCGRPRFFKQRWLADMALLLSGEPFVSGVALQVLPDWLAAMGFKLQQLAAADQAGNSDPCPGELLFFAAAKPVAI